MIPIVFVSSRFQDSPETKVFCVCPFLHTHLLRRNFFKIDQRAFPLNALAVAPTQFDVALNRFKSQAVVHFIEFFTRNLVVWSKLGPDLWFQSCETRQDQWLAAYLL